MKARTSRSPPNRVMVEKPFEEDKHQVGIMGLSKNSVKYPELTPVQTATHQNSQQKKSNRYQHGVGSVYRQATRFVPDYSSSTNVSGSLGGSIEVIVSELENPRDETKTESEISEIEANSRASLKKESQITEDGDQALKECMKEIMLSEKNKQQYKEEKNLKIRLQLLELLKQENGYTEEEAQEIVNKSLSDSAHFESIQSQETIEDERSKSIHLFLNNQTSLNEVLNHPSITQNFKEAALKTLSYSKPQYACIVLLETKNGPFPVGLYEMNLNSKTLIKLIGNKIAKVIYENQIQRCLGWNGLSFVPLFTMKLSLEVLAVVVKQLKGSI